jgi:hypothetical protein
MKKLIVIMFILLIGLFFVNGCASKSEPLITKPGQEVQAPSKLIAPLDCGTDFDCFIQASKDCSPSSVVRTVTLDVFGTLATSKESYELKGIVDKKCSLIQTVENEATNLIATQECLFPTDLLTSVLSKWKDGTFSSDEWVPYCTTIQSSVEKPITSKQARPASIVGQIDIMSKIPQDWRYKRGDDYLEIKGRDGGLPQYLGYVTGRHINFETLNHRAYNTTWNVHTPFTIAIGEFDSDNNAKRYYDSVIDKNRYYDIISSPDQQASEVFGATCQSIMDLEEVYDVAVNFYDLSCYKDNYYFVVKSNDVSAERAKNKGITMLRSIEESFREHQNITAELGVSKLNIRSYLPFDLEIVTDNLDFSGKYSESIGEGYLMRREIRISWQQEQKNNFYYSSTSKVLITEFDSVNAAQMYYTNFDFEKRFNYTPPTSDPQLSEIAKATCRSASRSEETSFFDRIDIKMYYDIFCYRDKYHFYFSTEDDSYLRTDVDESSDKAKSRGITILKAIQQSMDEDN